jgi:hypothetical protein
MQIVLSVEVVQQVLHVLNQLPNSSGTFPLMAQIAETANQQIKEQEAADEQAEVY